MVDACATAGVATAVARAADVPLSPTVACRSSRCPSSRAVEELRESMAASSALRCNACTVILSRTATRSGSGLTRKLLAGWVARLSGGDTRRFSCVAHSSTWSVSLAVPRQQRRHFCKPHAVGSSRVDWRTKSKQRPRL